MRVNDNDINRNNFVRNNKMTQIATGNKKQTSRTKQAHKPASQESEITARDSAVISVDEGQKAIKVREELDNLMDRHQELMNQLASSNEQSEALAEEAKIRRKCLLIAMRIMSGDTVPPEDQRYLAKNDLGLYARAIMMRTEKAKPKKHKRVSEDEETGDSTNTESAQPSNREIQPEASVDSAVSSEAPNSEPASP